MWNLLICFLGLAVGWAVIWDPVLRLEPDTKHSIGADLYLDTHNNQTYVILGRGDFEKERTFDFGVRQVGPDRTLGNFTLLDQRPAAYLGMIRGGDDGEHLMVAEVGSRNSSDGHCNETDTEGCIEIYFRESNDGGLIWTPAVRINRDNMSDSVSRLTPFLIQIRETGRLYLFYYYYSFTKLGIGYVTRPFGSQIFSKEKVLFSERNILFGLSAAYTHMGRVPLLHLSWAENDNGLMYSSSSDAMTWSSPTKLADGRDSMRGLQFNGLMANTRISTANLFFSFMSAGDNLPYLLVSSDEGRSWSTPVPLGKMPLYMIRSAYCGVVQSQLLFLAGISNDQLAIFQYNVTSQQISQIETSFPELLKPTIPVVVCARDPLDGHFVLKLIATLQNTAVAYFISGAVWPTLTTHS